MSPYRLVRHTCSLFASRRLPFFTARFLPCRTVSLLLCLVAALSVSAQMDPRGPIVSDQFVTHKDSTGIYATGLRYKPFASRPFAAKWIGMDSTRYPGQQQTRTVWTGGGTDQHAYMLKFRKLVRLGEPVRSAHIRISADIDYRLFINGRIRSRGPAARACDYGDTLMPTQWYFDEFDTREAFKKGINPIAVEVAAFDRIPSSTTMGHPGLIMEAEILLQSGRKVIVRTDNSWTCDTSKAYLPGLTIDASRETDSWYTDTVDHPDWSHAVVLPERLGGRWKLVQSQLPQLLETRVLPVGTSFPIHIAPSDGPQKIRLEFDRLYTGYLGFKVNGRAGARLHFMPAETDVQAAMDVRYILRDGAQAYEYPELTDAKYIDVVIENAGSPLTIDELGLNFSSFPVDYAGSFQCSDPELNRLWENIRWILQQNMQTYHMDSPIHQEPTSDAGDYLIESLINYYTFYSPLLVRQDLRKIASLLTKTDNRMFHTSYMLLWLQMLVHYYEYTGDQTLLRELSPAAYGLLERFHSYIGPEGIVSGAPDYMFMDWGELYGRSFHHPPASWGEGYMTAFFYRGLLDGARIASYLDDPRRSGEFSRQAAAVKEAFVSRLYDPQKGLFRSGIYGISQVKPWYWLPADTAIEVPLPHANILAALYDLAPSAQQGETILQQTLEQKAIPMSPYFMYFVLEAIAHTDRFDNDGFNEIGKWKAISQHPVGLREMWTAGDFSHAWGGSPAYELSSKVLGVYPSKPGYAEVTVFPHPGKLDYASGKVPTPRGAVTVNWHRSDTSFSLEYTGPPATPTVFILPLCGSRQVIVNGQAVTKNGKLVPGASGVRFTNNGRIGIDTKGGKSFIEVR